ncbi:MAG: preprotein translocase subunit SecG [bacterium]
MWYTILVVVQVVISILLILLVLIQQGRGADMGAAFGGASQTVFGAAGAGGFLGKLTAGFAAAFFAIALALARMGASGTTGSDSLIPIEEQPAGAATPAAADKAPAPSTEIPAVPTEPAPSAAAAPAGQPSPSTATAPTAPAPEAAPAPAAPEAPHAAP